MTFIEALKTGRPLNRINKGWRTLELILPGSFMEPRYLIDNIKLQIEDILADDWIIDESYITEDNYETVELC